MDIDGYDEILLDTESPGWKSDSKIVNSIFSRVKESDNWQMTYHKKSIFLWKNLRSKQ